MMAPTALDHRGLAWACGVADAVLYEGLVLYPYRAAMALDRLPWEFGCLFPPSYRAEPSTLRAECVIEEGSAASVRILLRFLHLETCADEPGAGLWDEGVEKDVALHVSMAELVANQEVLPFECAGGERAGGRQSRNLLQGRIWLAAERLDLGHDAYRLRLEVQNTTPAHVAEASRAEALRWSLVGAHVLLAVDGGAFVSAIDPPAWAATAVAQCRHQTVFPVLAGPVGDRHTMLAAPVMLEDHPLAERAEMPPEPTGAGDLVDVRDPVPTGDDMVEAWAADAWTRDVVRRAGHTAAGSAG